MDEKGSWLERNGKVAIALAVIFTLALFLRVYFAYDLAFPDRLFSGGSDSFYYERILRHAFETGRQLTNDPLLNYPLGLTNPRPPLFAWFSLLAGYIVSPLFGDAWSAITWVFLISTALFGALTIFPAYALAATAFGRRAGVLAAFFLAVMPAHMQRSAATNADHDSFVLFFIVTGFYFFLRGLRSLNERRWVERWRDWSSVRAGLRGFFRENPKPVLYSLMAGVSLAAVALTWQGWAYAPIILLVYVLVELFVYRFRNRDTLGISIVFILTMGVALLLAAPWYVALGQVKVWFDVPAYLFGVAVVLCLVFTLSRDYPWTIVIPSVLAAGGAALGVGVLLNPALANAFVSGAGYFVRTKLYETIAEAQAPELSQIILSFGIVTYFLAWFGVAFMTWEARRRLEPDYLFLTVWTAAALVMAQAAGRFIFHASPAFAVISAFMAVKFLGYFDLESFRRTYGSLARGGRVYALRKSLKVRHVTAAVIALLVVLPNVWYAVDAAIPFEKKQAYDSQLYGLLPEALRPAGYVPGSTFYLGAFGFSVPESREYFPAAWNWLSSQDSNRSPGARPAFLSWWDYGFEAADRGEHPTVADNFQNGYHLAGNFITAQSENEAIALLTLRLIEGNFYGNGRAFSPAVTTALTQTGVDAARLLGAFRNPAGLIPEIQKNPVKYGFYDAEIQPENALFIWAGAELTSILDTGSQADLYRAIRQATGDSIRYFMADSRLMPLTGQQTGIFYAPAKLSDHRLTVLADGRTIPSDFFKIWANVTGRGRVAIEDVRPTDTVTNLEIEYREMFWNSMFYRAYFGIRPSEAGAADDGLPGFSGATARNLQPMPGWGLSHWRVAYRTAYYNPSPDPANASDQWRAVNVFDAIELQQQIDRGETTGQTDLSAGVYVTAGLVFLKYYDGAWVNGTVTVNGERSIAGVRITVLDELGIPHYEALTDAQGQFSVLAPFGDVHLVASTGTPNALTRVGTTVLNATTIQIRDDQAMRENVDLDGDGILDWLIRRDIDLSGRRLSGHVFVDSNRDGVRGSDERTAGGAEVTLQHPNVNVSESLVADADGSFAVDNLYPGTYSTQVRWAGRDLKGPDINVASGDVVRDLNLSATTVRSAVALTDGTPVPGADVFLRDETNGTTMTAVTGVDGIARFAGILPGNVTTWARSGDLVSAPSRVRILAEPELTTNLILVPSGHVEGNLIVGGTARPYATATFLKLAEPSVARLVTADATGRFSVDLPQGVYSVSGRLYEGTTLFALLDEVRVDRGATVTLNLEFLHGTEVRGTATKGAGPGVAQGLNITFTSTAGRTAYLSTGGLGAYVAWLPRGAYAVAAWTGQLAAFRTIDLTTAAATLDVTVNTKDAYEAHVYRDLNLNAVRDPGEGIAEARATLRDSLDRTIVGYTTSSGELFLPLDPTASYDLTIERDGFAPFRLTGRTADELRTVSEVRLEPLAVAVTGSLMVDGAPLVGNPATVAFLGIGSGAVTANLFADASGRFQGSLIPGSYRIIVDQELPGQPDVRYQNVAEDAATVPLGAPSFVYDVDMVLRSRVSGNVTLDGRSVNASVSFEGAENKSVLASDGSFDAFLASGAYNVTATFQEGGDEFAFVDALTVTAPATLEIPLEAETRVAGTIRFAGTPVPEVFPMEFVREEGGRFSRLSTGAGTYLAPLPGGTYRVGIDLRSSASVNGVPRFVRYSFSGSVVVPSGGGLFNYDIDVSRTLDNVTVSGTVSFGGAGTDATITFRALDITGFDAQVTVPSTGAFVVPLAPSRYGVYAVRPLSSLTFLGALSVEPRRDATFNLTLLPGYRLSGVTTFRNGVRVAATLNIQSGPSSLTRTSDAFGAYSVILPAGDYTIAAETRVVENGIGVTYAAGGSTTIAGLSVENFELEKVVVRGISLDWDSSQRGSIPAGGSVQYSFRVTNTGNALDRIAFSSATDRWAMAFQPQVATVNFGVTGNATDIEVTVTAPADALVEHSPITIRAVSEADPDTEASHVLLIDVLRHRALGLALSNAAPTYDGKFLNYTIDLRNRGNGNELVGVLIPNLQEITAAGWEVSLLRTGSNATATELHNLEVLANQSAPFVLRLQGTSTATEAVVRLTAYSEDSRSTEAVFQIGIGLPKVSVEGPVTATGPDYALELGVGNLAWALLLSSVAIVVYAAIWVWRRRR